LLATYLLLDQPLLTQ